MKKVYEIGFPADDTDGAGAESVIWIATDRKIILRPEAIGICIKEIDINKFYPTGVDIIIE